MFKCNGYSHGDIAFRLEKNVVTAGEEGPRGLVFAKMHAPDETTKSLPLDR